MENIKEFIEKNYKRAIELKEKFKITENKNWDAITVLAELNVQLGHFSYLISSHKEYGEKGRKINNLGDEISDIVLQLFSLCWKLDLDIQNYDYNYNYIKFENVAEALLSFNVLFGEVAEKVLEKYEYRHYKIRYGFAKEDDFLYFNLARLLEIIFSVAFDLNLNLDVEFNKMICDANNFLKSYEKQKTPQFYPIVDVHATWLVLNPIQGCPKQCKYCFLNDRGLNKIKPITLASPEEAVKQLLESRFYISDMPLCLFSQTDAFSTSDNIEYLKQLIQILMEKEIKNPIIFISKCDIPDEFINFIDDYEKLGHKFIFFLSYSGLDENVEVGVNKKIIERNFVKLSKKGKMIIHYWRPFIPQNSKKEDIFKIYQFVKKYCLASVAIGLKTTNNIIDNIDWSELKENRVNALESDNVWDNAAYDYLWNELAKKGDYPIFQTTSCALGYALHQPDRKFFYNTDICINCNNCPKSQRNLCKKKFEQFVFPDKEYIVSLIRKLQKNINEEQIEFKDRVVIIKDLELDFNEISYLTEKLGVKILVAKKENGYYWNTSINNADILKI